MLERIGGLSRDALRFLTENILHLGRFLLGFSIIQHIPYCNAHWQLVDTFGIISSIIQSGATNFSFLELSFLSLLWAFQMSQDSDLFMAHTETSISCPCSECPIWSQIVWGHFIWVALRPLAWHSKFDTQVSHQMCLMLGHSGQHKGLSSQWKHWSPFWELPPVSY